MTNAFFGLAKHRAKTRNGYDVTPNPMMLNGFDNAYAKIKPVSAFADDFAREYQFSREAHDTYAIKSVTRATASVTDIYFTNKVAPLAVKTRGVESVVSKNEQPSRSRLEITSLKSASAEHYTTTAATSGLILDGAAAQVLTRASVAAKRSFKQEAVIAATARLAYRPAKFTTLWTVGVRTVTDWAGS